jgi:hypothetical protein
MRVANSAILAMACALLAAPAARAQVLIWNIPEAEDVSVTFEGKYRQTNSRPDSKSGEQVLEWDATLTISSLGKERADHNGRSVDCRWVEFQAVTKPGGVEKQAGPGGTYVYKVLIPEAAVIGKPVDDQAVPVTFLPLVKGFRKVGTRPVEPVREKALAVYPHLALLTYYPDLQPVSALDEELTIDAKAYAARAHKGSRVLTDKTSRSTNSATLWLAPELPFGLGRFEASVVREAKHPEAAADAFQKVSLVEVSMAVKKVGPAAASLIEVPQ